MEICYCPLLKNCETIIGQTHTEPQETLEFHLTEQSETLSFPPTISYNGSGLIGLTSLGNKILFLI